MKAQAIPFIPEPFIPVRATVNEARNNTPPEPPAAAKDELPKAASEPLNPDTTLLGMFSRVSQQNPSNVKVRALLASIRDYTETATSLLSRDPDNEQRRREVRQQITERSASVATEFLDAAKAAGEEVSSWNYNFLTRQLTSLAARAYAATGAVPSPDAMRLTLDTVMTTSEIQPPRVFADLPRTVEIRLALMAHFVPHAGRTFEEILDRSTSTLSREMLFCSGQPGEARDWEAGYRRAVAAAMDDLVKVSWKTASTICDHAGNNSERDKLIATKSIMASIATVQSMSLHRTYSVLERRIREIESLSAAERHAAADAYFEKYAARSPSPLQGLSSAAFAANCDGWWASVSQHVDFDVSLDVNENRTGAPATQGPG